MAKKIGEPPATEQKTGVGQNITYNHPLDRGNVQRERPGDFRKRDVDGAVEGAQESAQTGNDHRVLKQRRTVLRFNGFLVHHRLAMVSVNGPKTFRAISESFEFFQLLKPREYFRRPFSITRVSRCVLTVTSGATSFESKLGSRFREDKIFYSNREF